MRTVISRALGHTSPDSTEVYLSADMVHLKELSLSIEDIPVREGCSQVSAFNFSFFELFDSFVKFRKASNRWNEASYGVNLDLFDKYCLEYYPNETIFTQDTIDSWCRQRPQESNNGCISRIYVIVSLVDYLKERNLAAVSRPAIPTAKKRLYIPRDFTQDELTLFFQACDNYKPFNFRTASHLNIKYTLPVFFRLLYSSGMRTTEARLLRRTDIDRYYYHLVPSLSEVLQKHTEVGFNELIPEVEYEESE